MTIQANTVSARIGIFDFINGVEEAMERNKYSVNSIDLRLKDLALSILEDTCTQDNCSILKDLKYIEEYGDPDLSAPAMIRYTVNNLRFLLGE